MDKLVVTALDSEEIQVVATVSNHGAKQTLEATLRAGKQGFKISTETSLPLLELQNPTGVKNPTGLPMSGGLDANVSLKLPDRNRDMRRIKLHCPQCKVTSPTTKPSRPTKP